MFGKKGDEAVVAETAAAGVAVAPSVAAAATAVTHTVVSGDTLSKIAKHHLGDANAWPRIYEANRDVLDNPDRIFPGQVLRIP
jgi:nucleoid-associated protein YgaU